MKINITYFVYLHPNYWYDVVLEQLNSLKKSGLYDDATKIVIVTNGLDDDYNKLKLLISNDYNKINLLENNKINKFEYYGIKNLYDNSNDDSLNLYFHTKGVTSGIKNPLNNKLRKGLFKYTIENYKDVINEFKTNPNLDLYCAIPGKEGFAYYNFFWVRGKYIKENCVPPVETNDRFYWEEWVGSKYSKKENVITFSPIVKEEKIINKDRVIKLRDEFLLDTKDDKFSIVIPTMWKSPYISLMLDLYEKSKFVKEIIIIDNKPESKIDLKNFSKVVYYTDNRNIFVNPAWNIGYTLSSYKLILANDDIFFKNVDEVLDLINKNQEYDIIGSTLNNGKVLKIKDVANFPSNGFGCFMYIKDYKSIRYNYKIWRGDFLLFNDVKKRGVLSNPELMGDMSVTVSNSELQKIAKKDSNTYYELEKYNNKKRALFVLVNYGTEQIDYLRLVINKIKTFKKYITKIIVHSNIKIEIPGIDEVKIFDNLKDYQLLPLTCRKTILDNKDKYDLFIYGENDHLFEEYHLDKHIEYYEILPKNRISGLIQYEIDKNKNKYYPAYFRQFDWDYNSIEEYNGKKFAHFKNTHQATFIINNEQLNNISSMHDFTSFFGESQYSVKCKVNTDIYDFCNMKKMICISDFKDNLIHHLPNLYVYGDKGRNKFQRADELKMKLAIQKLLNIKVNPIVTIPKINNTQIKIQKLKYDISIIVPTYNNLNYINECINSIQKSNTNNSFEILIGVDGCVKTKNYLETLELAQNVRVFYFNQNLGPYSIKNTLAKIAYSDRLIFFDSDDVMNPNMVDIISNGLNRYICVKPKFEEFGGKSLKGTKFGEGVFGIRKDIFLSINGFEPWKMAADSDFMGRLYKKRVSILHTPQILFKRRIHSESLTNRKDTGMYSPLRAHYARLSKNKKGHGNPVKLHTRDYIEINISNDLEINSVPQKEKNSVLNLLNRVQQPVIVKEKKEVNYEKVNKVIYNKTQNKKPTKKGENSLINKNLNVRKRIFNNLNNNRNIGGKI